MASKRKTRLRLFRAFTDKTSAFHRPFKDALRDVYGRKK